MSMEFAKKYRPRTLDRVVGCDTTVKSLKAMLASGTVPHAILFYGPSGCGKTTLARILRTELGCSDVDFREINSASFRGIDTIRDIQQTMQLSPVAGPVRIWLIDEAHMWTREAQNAALKILEDMPSHVYFFLCTTDPQKLIQAIRTRCTEMPVRQLTSDELAVILNRVVEKEKLVIDKEVLDEIITSAQGSARAALVSLDKISSLPREHQTQALSEKMAEENEAIDLCRALIKRAPWRKVASLLATIKADPENVRRAVLAYARTVLLKSADYRAYLILDAFKNAFYESGDAGLALAAFEVVHAKQ